ncbi:MAG: ParA family protein [Oscillospiraceae bacterium]|nr:ParA family protein [Oscillospiraceae bacterium]
MGKIIVLANQKGGVGKTTCAVNTAAGIAALGKRVLLVDIDPQGNATSGLGINKRNVLRSSYEMLCAGAPAVEATVKNVCRNLDAIPSSQNLAGAEIELAAREGRESFLKKALSLVREQYDYIFIDCPPSLGVLTINALCACDSVLIPIQCEYYALEGLSQLMNSVRTIKRLYNPNIAIEGVVLTMYDGRLNLTLQVANEIKKYFPNKVYKTAIPRNVRLSEAPSFGKPVIYYDPASRGAKAYMELCGEIIAKNR